MPLTFTLVARSMSRWMMAATFGSFWSCFQRSTSRPISFAYRSRVSGSSWGEAKSRSCISQYRPCIPAAMAASAAGRACGWKGRGYCFITSRILPAYFFSTWVTVACACRQ